ncbi:MAG: reverse transcriptase/maturase family protein [Acidobacteria bacterium]|nr:reverse transcriptase/maturase family protein [Acidobacteriota bacterium]
MNRRTSPYDLLCDPDHLLRAWRQVRRNRGAAGIDLMTLAEFERELMSNLNALAARLREGRYYPMPARMFEMKKTGGGVRKLAILSVEDRIVQRAALDAIEPVFEAAFFDCSFGFRPNRNVQMAIGRALSYRAAGDIYVVDGDIADCFGSLDHDLLVELVSARILDKRLLGLIRMWLDCGQVLPKQASTDGDEKSPGLPGLPCFVDRLGDYATGSVNAAMSHLLDEGGHGYGHTAGYGRATYDDDEAMDDAAAEEAISEAQRQARKEAIRRLGRDGLLLLLTSATRARRWLTPATLAITGAAVLATAAYPRASRYLRDKLLGRRSGGVGALQGSPLSSLLSNVYLHEFDKAMMRAGLHLARYADDWIICCRDEQSAHAALELAARELHRLKLQLNPEKTRITRFDQGLEFLGYRFHPHLIAAAPAPEDERASVADWWRSASGKLRQTPSQIRPAAAQMTERAKVRTQEGLARLKALARRFRKGDEEE